MTSQPELWALVLAGGSGKRLEPLTTALYGHPVPKQYATLVGERSLLARTLARVAQLVPEERTLVVATQAHESLARTELHAFPGVKLVLQPQNLDTGVGVWVGLAQVLARDASARVLVAPSDHYARDEPRFIRALGELTHFWSVPGVALSLLGMRPPGPEREYGWIVLGQPLPAADASGPPLYRVERFVEKPSQEITERLWREGALWNTLAFSGLAEACWDLCARHGPEARAAFERYRASVCTDREEQMTRGLFSGLSAINLSTQVLTRARSRLGAIVCEDVGWSDIGTPQRVFEALAGTDEGALLQRRLAEREPSRRTD